MKDMLPTPQQGYDWSAAELVGAMKLNIGVDEILAALTKADDPRPAARILLEQVDTEHGLLSARVNHPGSQIWMTPEERIGAVRINCLLRDVLSDVTGLMMEWTLTHESKS